MQLAGSGRGHSIYERARGGAEVFNIDYISMPPQRGVGAANTWVIEPYVAGRLASYYQVVPIKRNSPTAVISTSTRLGPVCAIDFATVPVYFDALTHDAGALRYLIDKVGADRVTIGTDAPFDMAEDDPIAMLEAVEGLSAEQRDRIYGLNALELLGEKP